MVSPQSHLIGWPWYDVITVVDSLTVHWPLQSSLADLSTVASCDTLNQSHLGVGDTYVLVSSNCQLDKSRITWEGNLSCGISQIRLACGHACGDCPDT